MSQLFACKTSLCMCAKSLQSCLTFSNPRDCSPTGSSVHGILQARILDWVAMPSSRGSSTQESNRLLLISPPLAGGFFTASATFILSTSFLFLLISALISIHAFFQMLVHSGTFLVVQLLRFLPPNAGGTGSIPGQATKIPHATWQINNNDSSYEK